MAPRSRTKAEEVEDDSDSNILTPPTTFNGKLARYAYATSTTTTSTTGTPPTTMSPTKRITRSTSLALSTPPRPRPKSSPSKVALTPPTIPTPSPSPHNDPSTSPSKKRKRPSSKIASPTKYAHIPNLLTDAIAPNLILLFIGVNPGLATARTGHAYAHPSNLFWKLLHSSGITPRRCRPEEDHELPRLYGLGNTNIVARATKDAAELSRDEMDASVGVLEEKVSRWRPEAVCIVGKGIWESIWRARYARQLRKEEFRYGWQDRNENMGVAHGWEGARVFVATSTSGLAAGMRPAEKEAVWKPLGEWVCRRREERGWVVGEGPECVSIVAARAEERRLLKVEGGGDGVEQEEVLETKGKVVKMETVASTKTIKAQVTDVDNPISIASR